jgi:hypothetical protein
VRPLVRVLGQAKTRPVGKLQAAQPTRSVLQQRPPEMLAQSQLRSTHALTDAIVVLYRTWRPAAV